MPPLALTEANKESIRALVRLIMPKFEEALWEKARIRSEEELEAAKRMAEFEEQMRQAHVKAQMQQAGILHPSQASQLVSPVTITTTGTAAVGSASPIFMGGAVNIMPNSSAAFTSVGTGFTTYDATSGLQGLTLKKP